MRSDRFDILLIENYIFAHNLHSSLIFMAHFFFYFPPRLAFANHQNKEKYIFLFDFLIPSLFPNIYKISAFFSFSFSFHFPYSFYSPSSFFSTQQCDSITIYDYIKKRNRTFLAFEQVYSHNLLLLLISALLSYFANLFASVCLRIL